MKYDRDQVVSAYEYAKKLYASYGVDTDRVLEDFYKQRISLHCWQGDDIDGFEGYEGSTQNVVTGNYPGKAHGPVQLRADIEKVFSYSPISHKVNIHANYAEAKTGHTRETITPEDFTGWVEWAKKVGVGLDFNSTFFAHEQMNRNLSLTSPDKATRDFWIKHSIACRKVAEYMGKELGQPCVHNIWIPDGMKDNPASRLYFRELLKDSLDQILAEKIDKKYMVDMLEGKLFGIGTECYVPGSYDFYLAYALKNNVGICLDSGHYHPTEQIADKLSALSLFTDDILLHVSRGVRWDSDHAVIYNDELNFIMQEAKRANLFGKLHIGLDYFDASINRITAWTVGLRAAGRAMLTAMLEPTKMLEDAEKSWNLGNRLALSEEFKALPIEAVWNYACMQKGVAIGTEWVDNVGEYEKTVLSKRG